MMRLVIPAWLALIPILILVGWMWPRLRCLRPLRVLILALGVMALARPEFRTVGEGLDLWVLVDRSASAADRMDIRLPEWEAVLERSKEPGNHIRYLDYADVVLDRTQQDRAVFAGSRQQTHTALAVHHALANMENDRTHRILVLTDGFSTEPLTHLAERLADQQVPLDYRLLDSGGEADVRIDRMDAPDRVQAAEPFLVEVTVGGTVDQVADWHVSRDGTPVGEGEVHIEGGRGRFRFTDRVVSPGGRRYHVSISAADNALPGNDRAEAWVEVVGGPRILLVTGYRQDPVADMLRRQGFEVDVEPEPARLHPGRLSGARAVFLNNVPAYRLPSTFLAQLPFYVRSQAGGLAMAGGQFSFGSGGYFESAIDEVLPVSMDLREEHRKLSVAMGIVMDRSGSMGMAVAGGRTKMDLANEGAGRAIELLGGQDLVSVFAVDSKAHTVVPLTPVAGRQSALADTVRRIGSGGGGIYVYNGLKAVWEELSRATVGQRHIILFADAADAEQPDDYKALIGDMVEQDTTISVIGLGTDQDSDAAFLSDIAARGGGRIFFNANPADLPSLFAQEAVAVARSAFIEDPVPVEDAGGWLELAATPMAWMTSVDGYNLSYLRPEATAACLSGDDYQAPLVAFWRRGLGRTAAVSFPLGGEYSEATRAWTGLGDFLQTLARWLMGDDLPPGIGLRTRLEGTALTLDLLYDNRWEEDVSRRPPGILLAYGDREPASFVWERLAPGHYHTAVSLDARSTVRGAVQVGDAALPFGPVTAGVDAEWTFDRARLQELRTLAEQTGGGERLDLATIWDAPRRPAYRDLRPWLYSSLLLLILGEALVSRTGWTWPVGRQMPRPPGIRRTRGRVQPSPPQPQDPKNHPAPPRSTPTPPPEPDESQRRRERFARAKSRRH